MQNRTYICYSCLAVKKFSAKNHLTRPYSREIYIRIPQFSSVAQSCLTLCDPMNHSTPGLPVHQLPEFTQTHVHQVSDATQPSHPLSSPSPLTPQLLPASGSFPMSQLFAWSGQSTGVLALASFLQKNSQDFLTLKMRKQKFMWLVPGHRADMNSAPSLVPWLSTGHEGLQGGQAAGGWLQLLATECPRVLGKTGESVTSLTDNLQEKQTLQEIEIPPRDLGTCNITGPWMSRHISPAVYRTSYSSHSWAPQTACSSFWKMPGGLTTSPRPLLTGNLTPIPGEASVWYTCQMSTWDSAGGQVGSLMPGAWSAKAPAPSTDSLGIDPSCSGLLHTGLNWCACGSPEEMVCFLLRRPVSYSHASRQVVRWVTWTVTTNNHTTPTTTPLS